MASAAEQLAKNFDISTILKAKDLHQRLLFTLGVLVVYRIGTFIPVPGIDGAEYQAAFAQLAEQSGIVAMFNTFAGGAIEQMAIFALNVMPYITASIIMQLAAATVPSLERLKKEGETGRKQINQYTRYLTVLFAAGQGFAIALNMVGAGLVLPGIPAPLFIGSAVITLVGGTMLLMWLGEQVTARGVGNGISLIIFAGIVSVLPRVLGQVLSSGADGQWYIPFIAMAGFLGLIAFVVFMERSQRRLVVQYPKRQVGNRMMGGQQSFLPLKLNTSGVIPAIFASSLLFLPGTVVAFAGGASTNEDGTGTLGLMLVNSLQRGEPLYLALFATFIIFFCFFYTSIVFNPSDTADNLRKYGGFLPGIRPGKKTAEYIDYVLTRLTVIGAAYLTFVCVLPEIVLGRTNNAAAMLGGTSLLIIVTVTMDTVSQVQSHLLAHQYEGLIKKNKIRGGRRG